METFRCEPHRTMPAFEMIEAESPEEAAAAYEQKHGTLPHQVNGYAVFGRCSCGCNKPVCHPDRVIFVGLGPIYIASHVDIIPRKYLHIPPLPEPDTKLFPSNDNATCLSAPTDHPVEAI